MDDEQSALSRLKRELQGAIDGLAQKNDNFHTEVRETLARIDGKRKEAARSTTHGTNFQHELIQLLVSESQKFGDICEGTGNSTGAIKNCKIGDCLIELGAESQAPGARIVWEAKEDRSYDLKRALIEIEKARKNREAQLGVFVFSRCSAPDGISSFNRYGNDIVVTWESADPTTDVFVRAAYSVARALTVRQKAEAGKNTQAVHEIELAVRAIEKHLSQLEEIGTWAGTIESNGKKIVDRAKKMRDTLLNEIQQLDSNLGALRSGADQE
jgi:hypothetical protein